MDVAALITTLIQSITGHGTAIKARFDSFGLTKAATMGSLDSSNVVGGYAGVNMTATKGILRDNGTTHGFFRTDASLNKWLWQCDNSGNIIATGDVRGFSDGRLKENWRQPQASVLVDQLAGIKNYGTYDRIDIKATQIGVDAGELKETLLVHGVSIGEDSNQLLSLAYGQCALVGTIALAKQMKTLEQRLLALEEKSN